MSIHLIKEIDKLRKIALRLAGIVEENLLKGVSILNSKNVERLYEIRQADESIDAMEVEVEEECLKVLALHQPVAADLRYIVCIMKMNNDLERIGDLAINIAKKANRITFSTDNSYSRELYEMGTQATEMVHDALTTLINSDIELAREVCVRDDTLDRKKTEISEKLVAAIKLDPENTDDFIAAFGIVRNIERVGDLATNICEDVIYSLTGEIIRHNYHPENPETGK